MELAPRGTAAEHARGRRQGKLPLTELTFDRPAAPSPFGDDVKFPLPVENLNFAHPQQDS